MDKFLLSVLVALSLWPAYGLLCAVLRWRYGRAAVTDGIVADKRTFACMRLLVVGIAVPIFLYMLSHGQALHWLVFFYLLALLTLADIQMRLLPDCLLILLLAVGLSALAAGLPQMPAPRFALSAFVGAAMVVLLCMAVQAGGGRPGLAAGDVKLIAVLALWFPYNQLPVVLFVASFAGLVYILVIRCITGVLLRTIAFGPCLALGALAVHVSCDCPHAENGSTYCMIRPGATRPALFFTGVGVVQDRSDRGDRLG
ncbi:A24 family peptidase [Advenella sp. FME57]|uniref:prepilin peptidase n=1 Tax=Advenella sp. FME57 TaxID=2742604 RepID=UPI00186952D6|nr:A24 family peptidase [Advenella sp. FME57]